MSGTQLYDTVQMELKNAQNELKEWKKKCKHATDSLETIQTQNEILQRKVEALECQTKYQRSKIQEMLRVHEENCEMQQLFQACNDAIEIQSNLLKDSLVLEEMRVTSFDPQTDSRKDSTITVKLTESTLTFYNSQTLKEEYTFSPENVTVTPQTPNQFESDHHVIIQPKDSPQHFILHFSSKLSFMRWYMALLYTRYVSDVGVTRAMNQLEKKSIYPGILPDHLLRIVDNLQAVENRFLTDFNKERVEKKLPVIIKSFQLEELRGELLSLMNPSSATQLRTLEFAVDNDTKLKRPSESTGKGGERSPVASSLKRDTSVLVIPDGGKNSPRASKEGKQVSIQISDERKPQQSNVTDPVQGGSLEVGKGRIRRASVATTGRESIGDDRRTAASPRGERRYSIESGIRRELFSESGSVTEERGRRSSAAISRGEESRNSLASSVNTSSKRELETRITIDEFGKILMSEEKEITPLLSSADATKANYMAVVDKPKEPSATSTPLNKNSSSSPLLPSVASTTSAPRNTSLSNTQYADAHAKILAKLLHRSPK